VARPSQIRPAIERLLARGERHDWSIDDLLAGLQAGGLRADFSSVYRAIGQLERDGAVEQVDLGDGKARYEPAGEHHEHVRCEGCGAVAAIPGCLVEGVVPAVEERTGFQISDHRLLFSGRCGECAKA